MRQKAVGFYMCIGRNYCVESGAAGDSGIGENMSMQNGTVKSGHLKK